MPDPHLLAHLAELGATDVQLAGITSDDDLIGLAGDLQFAGGLGLSLDDLVRATGSDVERVRSIYGSVGLRAEGLAGSVPVTGIDGIQLAVEAVMNGEFAGTVAWDPFWQGGMGLSIAYHAKTGKFDPSKEGKDHREFYGSGIVITKDNAQGFYDSNIKQSPELDFADIWGRASGQIRYG